MQPLAEYETKKIKIDDSEVVIKKLSLKDQKDMGKIKDDTDRGIETLIRSIVKWDFAVNDSPLVLNKENIGRLRADIATKIGMEIMTFNAPNFKDDKEKAEKKKEKVKEDGKG